MNGYDRAAATYAGGLLPRVDPDATWDDLVDEGSRNEPVTMDDLRVCRHGQRVVAA